MTIDLQKFLDKYFRKEWLQEALNDIGEAYSTNKNEIIRRIIDNWTTYRRNWYDVLEYADDEALADICYDYGLDDEGDSDTLIRRIKRAGILNEQTKNTKKKSKSVSKDTSEVNKEVHFHLSNIVQSKSRKIGIFSLVATIIFFLVNPWYSVFVSDNFTQVGKCVTGEYGLTYKNCELNFQITRPSIDWIRIKDYESFVGQTSPAPGYLGGIMIGKAAEGNITILVYDKNRPENQDLRKFATQSYLDAKRTMPDWSFGEPLIEKDVALFEMEGEITGATFRWVFQIEYNKDKLYIIHSSTRTNGQNIEEFQTELKKAKESFGYLN